MEVAITMIGAGLRVLAEHGPAVYRAIVGPERSVEDVLNDARKAAIAIPTTPAADGIAEYKAGA
jgi:hypothetical protein